MARRSTSGDNRHPRGELALLGLDAEDAGVGVLEGVDASRRGAAVKRPGCHLLDEHALPARANCVERSGNARRHRPARLVGNERHAFARLDGEADFDCVPRARFEVGRCRAEE